MTSLEDKIDAQMRMRDLLELLRTSERDLPAWGMLVRKALGELDARLTGMETGITPLDEAATQPARRSATPAPFKASHVADILDKGKR